MCFCKRKNTFAHVHITCVHTHATRKVARTFRLHEANKPQSHTLSLFQSRRSRSFNTGIMHLKWGVFESALLSIYTCIFMYTHEYIHIYMWTYMYIHIYVYLRLYDCLSHTHTRTHTHTHTNTHTPHQESAGGSKSHAGSLTRHVPLFYVSLFKNVLNTHDSWNWHTISYEHCIYLLMSHTGPGVWQCVYSKLWEIS